MAAEYIQGLISNIERKNSWQMSEALGAPTPYAFQHLLGRALWNENDVRDDHIHDVVCELGNDGMLSIDETGFVKKGDKSAGVGRQYCGSVGKIENCQIGVFLNWKTPKGHILLDRELYLPKDWCEDRIRRKQAHIPTFLESCTKPQLAEKMLGRVLDMGIRPHWVLGDEIYGKDTHLRFYLEANRQAYVLAVQSNQYISIGLSQFAISKVVPHLPERCWSRLSAGTVSKGLRIYDWAAFPINHPYEEKYQRWALFRRSISNPNEIAYYLVFGPSQKN